MGSPAKPTLITPTIKILLEMIFYEQDLSIDFKKKTLLLLDDRSNIDL